MTDLEFVMQVGTLLYPTGRLSVYRSALGKGCYVAAFYRSEAATSSASGAATSPDSAMEACAANLRCHALHKATEMLRGDDDDATNAFVFTPKAGLDIDTRSFRLMLEYQGVDWLHQYRILAGLRWSM